jgi:hypothetical protein
MNTSGTLADHVGILRMIGCVEVTSYDELVAIQGIEPRAEVADTFDHPHGPFIVVCRPMTIDEAAASRGIVTYDTALPEAFIAEISALAGDPRRQMVWCYDTDVFGAPAAITPEGDTLLAAYQTELGRHVRGTPARRNCE